MLKSMNVYHRLRLERSVLLFATTIHMSLKRAQKEARKYNYSEGDLGGPRPL